MINYRDQIPPSAPPSTPERVRDAARRDNHEQRERDMGSPPIRRVPDNNNDPPNQQFNYLRPADLAQMRANLPLLNPVGQRRQAPVDPALALAPAFVLAPAQYRYLDPDLAQRVAALPPLGRGRRGHNPAPVSFADLANQVAALPPVCFF